MSSYKGGQIAKNTLMLYIRMLLVMGVSLYSSRIVLKSLGFGDFGIYNVIGGFVLLFSALNGALGSASARFITFETGKKTNSQLKNVLRTSFTIHLIFAVILFVILETAGVWAVNNLLIIPHDRLAAANWVFQFSIISSMVTIVQVPLTSMIIAHERMNFYAYLGIIEAVLKLAVVLLLVYSVYDKLITYGFLLLLVSILCYIVYYIYCKIHFGTYSAKPLFNKDLLQKMVGYIGWSFLGSVAAIFKTQGANILINLFFGPALNAARGIAYQVSNSINQFTTNFTVALNPQIIKLYAAGDITNMLTLMNKGAKYSYFLFLLFAVPILLETEFILKLWLGEIPEYTIIFTRLVIINALLESFTFIIGTSIQATGNIKLYQIIISGAILLNLPISYLFFKLGFPPQTTLTISIIISIIALYLRTIVLKYQIREFSLSRFIKNVFFVSLYVSFFAFIIPWIIMKYLDYGFIRFIVVLFASFASTSISILILGMNKYERDFIFSSVRKRLIK